MFRARFVQPKGAEHPINPSAVLSASLIVILSAGVFDNAGVWQTFVAECGVPWPRLEQRRYFEPVSAWPCLPASTTTPTSCEKGFSHERSFLARGYLLIENGQRREQLAITHNLQSRGVLPRLG